MVDRLFERGIYATATIWPNHKDLPVTVKDAQLKAGEMIRRMKDPQTVVMKWKDTGDLMVMFISTLNMAVANERDIIKQSQKGTTEKVMRQCPPGITTYHGNMEGLIPMIK